jgi:uncharacterized membrane protein
MSVENPDPIVKKHHSAAPIAMEVVGGAAAGAALGALAGLPGMAIGAALGSLVGAAAGVALSRTEIQHELDDTQLDVDIGVFGGNLGEAKSEPPAP